MANDAEITETSEPGVVEITVNSPKTDRSVTFDRNFGATLDESVAMFTADVVHSIFVAQVIIRAQSAARVVLDKDANGGDAAIEAGLAYVPGAARKSKGGAPKGPTVTSMAKAVASGSMTMEQVLEQLKAAIAKQQEKNAAA